MATSFVMANNAFDRTAGSHSLAAAGQQANEADGRLRRPRFIGMALGGQLSSSGTQSKDAALNDCPGDERTVRERIAAWITLLSAVHAS